MDSGKQFASIADLLFMERPQRTPQEKAALEEVLLLSTLWETGVIYTIKKSPFTWQ